VVCKNAVENCHTHKKAWESNMLSMDLVNLNPENQFLKEAREADNAE